MTRGPRSDDSSVSSAFPESSPAPEGAAQGASDIKTISLGEIEGKIYLDFIKHRRKHNRPVTSDEAHEIVKKYTNTVCRASVLNRIQRKGLIGRERDKHFKLDRDPVMENVIVLVRGKQIWPKREAPPKPETAPTAPLIKDDVEAKLGQLEAQAETLLKNAFGKNDPPIAAGYQLSPVLEPLKMERRDREKVIKLLVLHEFLLIEERRGGSQGNLYKLNIAQPSDQTAKQPPTPPAAPAPRRAAGVRKLMDLPAATAVEPVPPIIEPSRVPAAAPAPAPQERARRTLNGSATGSSTGLASRVEEPLNEIRARRNEIKARLTALEGETKALVDEDATLSARELKLAAVLNDAQNLDARIKDALGA